MLDSRIITRVYLGYEVFSNGINKGIRQGVIEFNGLSPSKVLERGIFQRLSIYGTIYDLNNECKEISPSFNAIGFFGLNEETEGIKINVIDIEIEFDYA